MLAGARSGRLHAIPGAAAPTEKMVLAEVVSRQETLSTSGRGRMHHALEGLRVLDFSESIAGQYCGRLLADYGADVALIEPDGGSVIRRTGPLVGDESFLFRHLNTGKRSVLLSGLSTMAGSQEDDLLAHLRSSDVVILSDPALAARVAESGPRVVVGLITGIRADGHWAAWRGGELIYQSMSGMMVSNGAAGSRPSMAAASVPLSRPASRPRSASWRRSTSANCPARAKLSISQLPKWWQA